MRPRQGSRHGSRQVLYRYYTGGLQCLFGYFGQGAYCVYVWRIALLQSDFRLLYRLVSKGAC
jgi:hypothetical protein